MRQPRYRSERTVSRIFAVVVTGIMLSWCTFDFIAYIMVATSTATYRGVVSSNGSVYMFFFRRMEITDPASRKTYSCYYSGLLSKQYDIGKEVIYKHGRTKAVLPPILFNTLVVPTLFGLVSAFAIIKVIVDVMKERRFRRSSPF